MNDESLEQVAMDEDEVVDLGDAAGPMKESMETVATGDGDL